MAEIVPDTKDWTWVLQRPCPECGFNASGIGRSDIPTVIRENAEAWQDVFRAGGELHVRRRPDVWSPLEYACHVRDVFRIYEYRLGLMLSQDDPHFPNWDQDATAVQERYGEQDPAKVIVELGLAAESVAAAFARVEGDQWARTGNRSDGARFTVESIGRYFVHDPIHHLHDVTSQLN
ncbi:DinB family protein [Allorhizocola rhizosphaerae]|uniref:DinB family protein n=1 Tax=Allorhizocola rhizosphaerae TaxID=1872709 RepID=UPI000E3BA64B|nr:DinB family protein [Allorhizocola rhizosphaerae]